MSLILPHISYTPDDTYIHLQFARNLLRGDGFSFNRGEPTYGSTSPLWVFMIAAGGVVSSNLLIISKILSICFTLGSIVLFALLAKSFLQVSLYVFACTLVWSVDSWFLRWAPSGMETSCALFFLLLGLFLYRAERSSAKKIYISPLVCALFTLIRPEGVLLFLLCILDQAVHVRQRIQSLVNFLLAYIFILTPWVLFAYVHCGDFVPNTFIAKSSSPYFGFDQWTHSLFLVFKFVVSNRLWETILIIIGVVLFSWKNGLKKEWFGEDAKWFVIAAWMVLLPIVYIVKGLPVVTRYLLLITPAVILSGFYFLIRIFQYARIRDSIQKWIVLTLVILSLTLNAIVSWAVVYPHVRQFTEGMRECFIPIGKWFAAESPEKTTIAALDIGALGFFSERRILDLGGLITPGILPLLNQHDPEELADSYPYLELSLPRADYIVYRSKHPHGAVPLKGVYEPLFTKRVSSLGITADPGDTYYTVCRIRWDLLNKANE